MSQTRKTLAVVFEAPRRVSVREVDIPGPGDDEVVVQTEWSWISPGTELSFLRGERVAGDTAARPGDSAAFPIVAGYQKVGRIVELGWNVHDLEVGQRVFATLSRVEGMFDAMGGHLQHSVTPVREIYPLASSTCPPECFSGAVLTQVGYNCGMKPSTVPGDAAIVLGDGLVGLWTAQTLQMRGVRVWLVGRHEDRLARFAQRKGDRIFAAGHETLLQALQSHRGETPSVLVDTIGSVEAITSLAPHLRLGGHVVAGFYGLNEHLSIPALRQRELSLHTPCGWTRQRVLEAIRLIGEGHFDTKSLITHRLPVAEAPRAYEMLLNRTDNALGVLLQW